MKHLVRLVLGTNKIVPVVEVLGLKVAAQKITNETNKLIKHCGSLSDWEIQLQDLYIF